MPCNLQPDPPIPTHFKGTIGSHVSLTVKGTAGTATMIDANYAGNAIPINPATFDIQAGSQTLAITYDNDTPGDITQLLCDDGTVLHAFPFNPLNPTIFYAIRGI